MAYWPGANYYGPASPSYPPFYGGQMYMGPGYMSPPMMGVPPSTMYVSKKWPKLNQLLAAGETLVRYDVRKHPKDVILGNTYVIEGHQPAVVGSPGVSRMVIISKVFPWSIEIKLTPHQLTCRHVWDALHDALDQPIDDSEWGMIVTQDKKIRETVEKAALHRLKNDKSGKKLKRIDFLGDKTMFKGLERDEEFEKIRLLPGSEACAETWVATFS
ncbi:hypothetical protein AMATHDRAFT_54141 [Amanita thiersii Skay4041]|uniref:DUF6699 domain-containing protein n=1 Tax=Amanita thiersii Skay4041 TaxID=703135 RepID=A0A2A9NYW3_9AGAR|nr:hypothetical protein AMATHDRAFT_54141 [Amanita thiersii Skay4041]